jgi:hypothetical protein
VGGGRSAARQDPVCTARTAMRICVAGVTGRATELDVQDDDSVQDLKAQLEKQLGVSPAHQRLFCQGLLMGRGKTMSDFNIEVGAQLQLVVHEPRAPRPEQLGLDRAIADLVAKQEAMRHRWHTLHEDQMELRAVQDDLARRNSAGKLKSKVKINVGGVTVTTTRATLTHFPDSKLAALFSGRWDALLLRDSKKRVFIDQNVECFRVLVTFLIDRQAAGPEEPYEVPSVRSDLQPAMDRMLVHFGLHRLFTAPSSDSQEGVPPAAAARRHAFLAPEVAQPEPEVAQPANPVFVEVVEVRRAGEELILPAWTIDHIMHAEFGVPGQADQSVDVTEVVCATVGADGSLRIQATAQDLGISDPSDGLESSLTVTYAACQLWEQEPFDVATRAVQAAAADEQAVLRAAISQHERSKRAFEQERAWIERYYAAKQPVPELPELVELDVLGERICVRRTTLTLCAESALARRFGGPAAPEDVDDDDSDDSDDSDGAAELIQADPRCFGKIVDQLRLIALAPPGEPPPSPEVEEHERERYERTVRTFFGGMEDFLQTRGVYVPLGQPPFEVDRTQILTSEEMKRTLLGMLPDGTQKLRWLLDSTGGTTAARFDSAVKGQGAFLVVVREKSNQWVFGAFCAEEFGSKSGWHASPGAFLFTLGNVSGSPVKLVQSRQQIAVHFGSCGCHFCNTSQFVTFCSNSCGTGTFDTIAPGYAQAAINNATLNGVANAQHVPDHIEVFAVS